MLIVAFARLGYEQGKSLIDAGGGDSDRTSDYYG
jgi:hypothetical protein